MRTLPLIALAILTFTLASAAQTKPAADSTSRVTATESLNVPDDEAFAAYLRVTSGMKPPKATKSPDPKYPELPSDAEPNGVVVMLVGINAKGRVELVHVLRSSNAVFEASAVTTVRTWKFSPAKKDGQPVPVQITVEMKFQK